MSNYISSKDPLHKRRLMFHKDADGVIHLNYDIVSYYWLMKHYSVTGELKLSKGVGYVYCFNCKDFGLTGNEVNDLTLEDCQ